MIGIVAGLRAMMAPVLVSWAAYCGLVAIKGGWLEWLGYHFTPWILTVAALVELVTDKLPSTPSRRVPQQFGARLVSGGLAGAALASASASGGGSWIVGLVAGVAGAVVG
ncbi:DUF4126 family protein, partial [Novosphingobium sp. ZW T3_23]|uniref:DUF4126 family protein n=1 Tax=Novosphingobium sp. ZW T3_23 TaxID=3378084 RepID=UPI0038542FF8